MTKGEFASEHDRLFNAATACVRPLIEIHAKAAAKLSAEEEHQLWRGLGLFDRVVQMNPQNWAAMWFVGKAFQRLHKFESALEWFSRAHEINPAHPDVSREAAIAAMELGRPEQAIPFCERAIEAKPDDSGLRANLALATLFSGDARSAQKLADDASRRDPRDEITRRIADLCREVLSGKRPGPRHVRDLNERSI